MQISLPVIQPNSPPDTRTAELSIFGPGIGECLVLHYGDGNWFIIDSCLCPSNNRPIALNYLESIGVDVETQVRGILITHWHKDHIEGVYEIFKRCENAKLYLTAAFQSKEAATLASIYSKEIFSTLDREITDFAKIVKYVRESKNLSRIRSVKANHTFFCVQGEYDSRMVALSPSDASVNLSLKKIVENTPKVGTRRNRAPLPQGENLDAVAVHFSFGSFSSLLGSDLEDAKSKNINTGWSAIFNSGIVTELSIPKSSLFKVAHHGSENGHNDKIWTDLLEENPISLTTPFTSHKLPKNKRIDDISALSSSFIVTGKSQSTKKIKNRDSMVTRELKTKAKALQLVNNSMGHIRVRATLDSKTTISVCNNCIVYK